MITYDNAKKSFYVRSDSDRVIAHIQLDPRVELQSFEAIHDAIVLMNRTIAVEGLDKFLAYPFVEKV